MLCLTSCSEMHVSMFRDQHPFLSLEHRNSRALHCMYVKSSPEKLRNTLLLALLLTRFCFRAFPPACTMCRCRSRTQRCISLQNIAFRRSATKQSAFISPTILTRLSCAHDICIRWRNGKVHQSDPAETAGPCYALVYPNPRTDITSNRRHVTLSLPLSWFSTNYV
ncbi:hypothetical protein BDW22DRAFT_1015006 [Trametopsis cervina]|nr:hypothetical protein BDW22DRAFT_1015006 [Trametopsis cervina]